MPIPLKIIRPMNFPMDKPSPSPVNASDALKPSLNPCLLVKKCQASMKSPINLSSSAT